MTLLSANYVDAIFQLQVCVYRSKEQYDRSHELLSEMLVSEMCTKTLSPECINAIQQFQIVIKEKDSVGKLNVSLQSIKLNNSKGVSIRGNYEIGFLILLHSIILLLSLFVMN